MGGEVTKGKRVAKSRQATYELDDGTLVRRCGGCREVKELNEENFYVSKRGGKRHSDYFMYACKPCQIHRSVVERREARLNLATRQKVKEREARWAREWRRRNPEKVREIRQRYRARLKADPQRAVADREAQRLRYRMRQERYGRKVERCDPVVLPQEPRIRLPALPLAEAVMRAFQFCDSEPRHFGDGLASLEDFCEPLGVSSRTLLRWRNEKEASVELHNADSVLVGLGLLWFDVWPPEDFPDVAERLAA